MARKSLTAVIAVIVSLAILLAMLAGCGAKSPEERFEEWKKNSDVALTGGAHVLHENALTLLLDNGILVEASYVCAGFIDGIPHITFVALVSHEEGPELRSYSVETTRNGPIASAFNAGSDSIWVYEEMFYVENFFENANYELKGDEIVVTE